MASLSGAVPVEHETSSMLGRSVSYQRTGFSSRSCGSIVNVPVEQPSVQSGVQVDWPTYYPPSQPTWVTRNDSTKAFYEGSDANVPFKQRLKRGVGLSDSRHADVWKAAAVEFLATTGLTFLSITVYLQDSKSTSVASLALLQALIYSLAILAAAPISGGHLNPAITFTSLVTGQATLIRSALYIVAQLLGGVVGAVAVRVLISEETRRTYSMGGCLLQESGTLSNNQGLVAEMVFTVIMLFIVYGVAFDTRSMVVTFPIITPFIIGGVFGILIFISQGVGYTAVMNPARCFGPAVVYGRGLWNPLYAFVMGPLTAALLAGVLQILVHQAHGGESAPVLPLNFFQAATPEHRRGTSMFNYPVGANPQAPDQDVPHSPSTVPQPLGAPSPSTVPAMTSNVWQLREPGASRSNKFNLTLQIKAFMQPIGLEGYHGSAVNIAEAASPADQDHQRSSTPSSPDGADHHECGAGDPEKDR